MSYNEWYNQFRAAAFALTSNPLVPVVALAVPPHVQLLDRWENNESPFAVAAEYFGGINEVPALIN